MVYLESLLSLGNIFFNAQLLPNATDCFEEYVIVGVLIHARRDACTRTRTHMCICGLPVNENLLSFGHHRFRRAIQ